MVTDESPKEYLVEISVIWLPVLPSKKSNSGAAEYPLPPETISIKSTLAKESTLIICGREALGFNVLSVGKSYPTSLIFTLSITPISSLTDTKSPLTPSIESIDSIEGKVV